VSQTQAGWTSAWSPSVTILPERYADYDQIPSGTCAGHQVATV
jgi:hypothetical protein